MANFVNFSDLDTFRDLQRIFKLDAKIPHAQELLKALHEGQIIWGSDWPHTQHESPTVNSRVHQLSPIWGLVAEQAAVRTLFDLGNDVENRVGGRN